MNGTLLTDSFPSENLTFPILPHHESYRVRVDFGTTNHEQTPRIVGLHSGAVRVLNAADGTNGWTIPTSLNHNDENISNPTLNTVRISGSSVYVMLQ